MSDSFHKYIQVTYLFNFLKCKKVGMAPHDKGYGCELTYTVHRDKGRASCLQMHINYPAMQVKYRYLANIIISFLNNKQNFTIQTLLDIKEKNLKICSNLAQQGKSHYSETFVSSNANHSTCVRWKQSYLLRSVRPTETLPATRTYTPTAYRHHTYNLPTLQQMLDMLSIVSYASQVPPYKVEIHERIFHCELQKFIFWYFISVLKLCMQTVWFTDSSPYTNITWVMVKGMCWSHPVTTDNAVCRYSTQSIHECPCYTDSNGILLKQCTTAVLHQLPAWKIGKVSDPCMFQNWPCPQGNQHDYFISTHIKLHNSFGMMLWNFMYLSVLNPEPDILWIYLPV
jgi:hypothetical protein